MPRIEEELQQSKPYESDSERALVNMYYTSLWINDQMKDFFKTFNTTPKQFNILRILNGSKGPMTTSLIKERMIERGSDITRIIDRMLKKGLLTRHINVQDRRLVEIQITTLGLGLLDQVDSSAVQPGVIMSALSLDECQRLNDLLDKLREPSHIF